MKTESHKLTVVFRRQWWKITGTLNLDYWTNCFQMRTVVYLGWACHVCSGSWGGKFTNRLDRWYSTDTWRQVNVCILKIESLFSGLEEQWAKATIHRLLTAAGGLEGSFRCDPFEWFTVEILDFDYSGKCSLLRWYWERPQMLHGEGGMAARCKLSGR